MARLSGPHPRSLLASVFVVASLITAVLSLDATVVLLTPVVFATATHLGVRQKPHVYACTHLSNSGSLLLPVSNLTNLLAFAASGLTLTRFAALMALPWVAAIAGEYIVFRRFFAADLNAPRLTQPQPEKTEVPLLALVVLALTLAGFVFASVAGVSPAWAASAGVVLLGVPALVRRRTTFTAIRKAAAVPFLLFVVALTIVVRAVVDKAWATSSESPSRTATRSPSCWASPRWVRSSPTSSTIYRPRWCCCPSPSPPAPGRCSPSLSG
jgi:arsenical pump membrane protein